jgi:hypothetical protein
MAMRRVMRARGDGAFRRSIVTTGGQRAASRDARRSPVATPRASAIRTKDALLSSRVDYISGVAQGGAAAKLPSVCHDCTHVRPFAARALP